MGAGGGGVLCSAQLVKKANVPRSTEATILDIFRFDIDDRMNFSVWSYNQKIVLKDLFP
jgi:hypothetical protein